MRCREEVPKGKSQVNVYQTSEKTNQGRAMKLARQRLRAAILRGEFAPGSVLTQAELSSFLNIGRTPLREAIRVVQEEGLIVSQPNRTVRVAGMSLADIDGLYALRIVHEAAAVRLTVPNLLADDIGELRELVAKMDYFAESQNYEHYSAPHHRFHALLISKQGAREAAFYQQLFDHSERYRYAYASSDASSFQLSGKEHHALLEAATNLDGVRCAQVLVNHYARTAATVAEQIDPAARLPRVEFACAVALGRPDLKGAAVLWQRVRNATAKV